MGETQCTIFVMTKLGEKLYLASFHSLNLYCFRFCCCFVNNNKRYTTYFFTIRVLNISFCRKFEISKFRKFVFCHISGIRIIRISEFAKFEYRILKKTEKNACFSQDILWCSMANMPIQDSIVKQIQNSTTFCYLGRGRPRRNMHMHVHDI